MNIYFTLSLRNALTQKGRGQALVKQLQSLGHKVTLRVIHIDDIPNAKEVEGIMIPVKADLSEVYKTTVKRIREADVVIADTTISSSSVGYEIAMAQSERKPILVLHDSNNIEYLADVVGGNTSKSLKILKFTDNDIPQKELEAFLKDARDLVDTKFILIISPEIDRYLTWSSETKRLHKAQIVRNAVEDVIDKDKEYKEYSKERNT